MGKFKRSQSSIINLRVFHNWVKNELYKNVAFDIKQNSDNNTLSILELAVGRAGDLYKWIGINATEVIGVDIDDKSIFGQDLRRKRNSFGEMERTVGFSLVSLSPDLCMSHQRKVSYGTLL